MHSSISVAVACDKDVDRVHNCKSVKPPQNPWLLVLSSHFSWQELSASGANHLEGRLLQRYFEDLIKLC